MRYICSFSLICLLGCSKSGDDSGTYGDTCEISKGTSSETLKVEALLKYVWDHSLYSDANEQSYEPEIYMWAKLVNSEGGVSGAEINMSTGDGSPWLVHSEGDEIYSTVGTALFKPCWELNVSKGSDFIKDVVMEVIRPFPSVYPSPLVAGEYGVVSWEPSGYLDENVELSIYLVTNDGPELTYTYTGADEGEAEVPASAIYASGEYLISFWRTRNAKIMSDGISTWKLQTVDHISLEAI